jgi:hypothetical protein
MPPPKKKKSVSPPAAKPADYTEEIRKMDKYAREYAGSRNPSTMPMHVAIPVRAHDHHGPSSAAAGTESPQDETAAAPSDPLDLSSIEDTLGSVVKIVSGLAGTGLKQINAILGGISPSAHGYHGHGHHQGHHGSCCCGPQHHEHRGHHGHHGHGHHCGCGAPAIGNYSCCEPGVHGC